MSVLIQDRDFQTIEEMSTGEYDALPYQELQQRFPEMRYACLDLNALAEVRFVMKFPMFERVRKAAICK